MTSYLQNSSELAPALTHDETQLILSLILDKVKLLAAKMVNAANNIKQQLQAQGLDMEDSKIMVIYILPHFTSGYKDIKNQVLNEYDVEEYELEEATLYYMDKGDETIRETTKKIRKLYNACGGNVNLDEDEDVASVPSKGLLPFETVLEILQVIGEITMNKTDEFIVTFKEKYGLPKDQDTAERFQQGLMSISERLEATCSCIVMKIIMSHNDLLW